MLPVKTEKAVPKDKMMDVMALLRSISVTAPIAAGTVVAADVFGTNIIATGKAD